MAVRVMFALVILFLAHNLEAESSPPTSFENVDTSKLPEFEATAEVVPVADDEARIILEITYGAKNPLPVDQYVQNYMKKENLTFAGGKFPYDTNSILKIKFDSGSTLPEDEAYEATGLIHFASENSASAVIALKFRQKSSFSDILINAGKFNFGVRNGKFFLDLEREKSGESFEEVKRNP